MATACSTVETFFEQVHTVDQTVLHQGFQSVFVGSRLWSLLLPPALQKNGYKCDVLPPPGVQNFQQHDFKKQSVHYMLFETEFDSHTMALWPGLEYFFAICEWL